MIRRRIPLTTGAARCPDTRQQPCSRSHECARGVEPHAKGREVRDFSAEPRIYGGPCGYFLAIAYADAAPAGPKVHEAPGRRYFLSAKACAGILRRAEARGARVAACLAAGSGGGCGPDAGGKP